MRVKSVRFSMLRKTEGKFENDRAECEVELGPKDTVEAAFATAIDVCQQGLGMSPDTVKPYRPEGGALSASFINRIKQRALSRPVDLGMGGVETFVSGDETTIPRETLAELCDLAIKNLPKRKDRW